MIRMKAFYITGPQQYEFRDIPMPKLQTPTDVLVKVKAAGICGSDIHSFNGDNINFEFGRIPGHEITAEVVEVGPAVTTLRPGTGWYTKSCDPAANAMLAFTDNQTFARN